jgi:hypothetical protein
MIISGLPPFRRRPSLRSRSIDREGLPPDQGSWRDGSDDCGVRRNVAVGLSILLQRADHDAESNYIRVTAIDINIYLMSV